jgi:sigma-B regulation protein RsbU (phosphoserine phosphatase)
MAVVLRDAQHRHQRQTLLETRNRDLELEVQQRTRALSEAHERLKQEVLMASAIQRDLLVGERELHRLTPGLEVGVLMIPSKEVGGDLYDCIAVGAGRYCFCVGDVAGKGMPAALLMSTCLSLLRSYAEILDSPAAIARRLNQRLCHNNEACAFTTLVVGSLDTHSGELRWCNAGHVPLLVQRPDGSVSLLSPVHGPALGVVEGANYGEGRLSLEPGCTLLGFTDGASEMASEGNGRFGIARVVDFMNEITRNGPESAPTPPRLVRGLMRRLREFAEGVAQQDDITLLALRLRLATAEDGETKTANGSNVEAMESSESLHLPIGNAVAAMARAKEAVGDYCRAHSIQRPLQRRLLVVIDELLNNTIHHGCPSLGDGARITLDLQRQGDVLELLLRDNGTPPFNPLDAAPPDLEGDLEDRAIGGLGIHLVRRLSSSVTYEYINGFNQTRVLFPLDQPVRS